MRIPIILGYLLPCKGELLLIEHEYMDPELTQAEVVILGTCAKMFTIAGPVLVYGLSASVLYGLIYWLLIAL